VKVLGAGLGGVEEGERFIFIAQATPVACGSCVAAWADDGRTLSARGKTG